MPDAAQRMRWCLALPLSSPCLCSKDPGFQSCQRRERLCIHVTLTQAIPRGIMGIHPTPTDRNLCWLMNKHYRGQSAERSEQKARGGKDRSACRTAHLGPFSVI